jgi:hypothetical protein
MEFAIIFVILLVLGVFLWISYGSNKKQDPHKGQPGSNPNPNAPTSEKRL